ncbi:MAG TPA: acetyl-lysine deacetylase [Anaerolinea thermolimosa]|uniref:Putative [LysW]-lysine hydrolase n=1 Tax=Anaerolinea thermolimosa TaxID=229919 RepID=A0A3D1JG46_9CHLR|nr:[LysW]-lysine hydrolase [Anaerolinea thermolimosa]GAP06938.1 acetylornithine deacetylase [Anaerolinea thermolimosa]HCE17550.1 acetyl-lysine deacetylase [Anaerolinea thermolimosa]
MDDLSILIGLLNHYSPTGSESSAVNYLVDLMNQLGFQAHVDRTGNAVGILGEGPRELVLLGHIDTVPGEIPVQTIGDRLYGRGAVDAKGPLACFTAAAARVGARAGWRIVVIGALAEEGDSRGARGILADYHPDGVLIGEPSGWDHVTLGYKGSAWVRLRIDKPVAHTAAQLESACEAAVEAWNLVKGYTSRKNAGKNRIFDQLTPSLRDMKSSTNGFVHSAQLEMNFRLPPDLSSDDLISELQALAPDAKLDLVDWIPSYRAEKNTPLVRAMLAGIRSLGGAPTFSLKTGTADLNIVAPAWKCQAVAYGPGDSSLDHTPEEHILISEYHQSIAVLSQALLQLTS